MSRNKHPKKEKGLKPTGKQVRTGGDPESSNDKNPVWKVEVFDADGPWGRKAVADDHPWAHILPKLKNYESMTWNQICMDRKRNHSIPVSDLTKDAQDRIIELRLDVSELFRLRLNGTQRLWGIRDREALKLLWWDPDHQICPSTLRNT